MSAPGPDLSSTHIVLIPSYNPGPRVFETVRAARAQWQPVWVVIDGSTDGTAAALASMAQSDPGLHLLTRARNGGKGRAVLEGLEQALRQGFTHALVMDSDGQHPAQMIAAFMKASMSRPGAMVLADPVFDASAPLIRVKGRRISNGWANLETLWAGIPDSLCGFRVYPIAALVSEMHASIGMRRFDFDAEAAVRLSWRGVPAVNLSAPIRYFSAGEGGVSHFNYWRDNLLLTFMHARLFLGFLIRLPYPLLPRLASRLAHRLAGRPPHV